MAQGAQQTTRGWWLVLPAVVLVLATDLVSKAWARAHLSSEHPTSGLFRLGLVFNHGAAGGIGASSPASVVAVELVALVLVIWWLLTRHTSVEQVGVAAVLGGALGNVVDRLTDGGAVTDWIRVWLYAPYFNVADVAIRGGAVVALVGAAVRVRRERAQGRSAASLNDSRFRAR